MTVISNQRKVLGIDCGTAITGWAVLQQSGNTILLKAAGAIFTPAKEDTSLRLKLIFDSLSKIISAYKPKEMAVESLFFFKNQKTVMQVSQARGVILLCGAISKLKIASYTPLQVKSAVTGYGRAEKKQVQFMVKKILRLKETPKPDDVADAIAIAICHLNSSR